VKSFFSRSQDPFFHLAVEEWLLRDQALRDEEVWFFYQNAPCVVLGRFQNPWKEADLPWLTELGAPLVRRPSGGGTVWHDLGNLNFCRVAPAPLKRDEALKTMVTHLKRHFGVSVEINARFDLVTRQSDGSTRKVSGSAYKQTKDRALHHATLLLHADLAHLERSLHTSAKLSSTKSIASVRSQVQNLGELNAMLTAESFLASWGECQEFLPDEARFPTAPWRSWQWRFGETPHFTWEFELEGHRVALESHKGRVVKLSLDSADIPGLVGVELLPENMPQGPSLSAWQSLLGCQLTFP